MKSRTWLLGWFGLAFTALFVIGNCVYKVDPFFHYHKPNIESFYYKMENFDQRSQNDGICKQFDYDAMITGTSMTENFKTSEMDKIFGCHSIKVPYSGGSYKEINDNLVISLQNNSSLKVVVRCLDMSMFFDDKNSMMTDLGAYPTYLYDRNPFNDVKYLFSKKVIFEKLYQMMLDRDNKFFVPGITSFDEYSNWHYWYTYGIRTVCPTGIVQGNPSKEFHLTEKEKENIRDNIVQNVTSLAEKYPDVDFYYFFPPYSVVWWNDLVNNGNIYKQIEAEQYVIELILEQENIKLYSFNNCYNITTDLNNYKDYIHYGQWINSMILKWMYDGKYLLTSENYLDYLDKERYFYTTFDYMSINGQEDYESDFYAAALLNQEYAGVEPINLLESEKIECKIELKNAYIVKDQYKGTLGIRCVGSLRREAESGENLAEYIFDTEYIGAKIQINNAKGYRFLTYYGKKEADQGQPTVYIYDRKGLQITGKTTEYFDLDGEWHQYVVDLTDIGNDIIIIFNGGYIDNTGSADSTYVFSDIMLY